MELIKELLQLLEAPDAQLERLRDQKHELADQIEDIEAAGGEVPDSTRQKMKQLIIQIKAKLKMLGAQQRPTP
jgi:uncharacterized protein YdcH (DUF465 family)